MWELCILCCGCLLIPLYILAALLIPVGLALGIINLQSCSIEPNLPLWLIYFNGFVFVRAIISCCVSCCCDKDGWCAAIIKNVVFVGDIVLMILGALYLLPIVNRVDLEDSKSLNYCNKYTYIVAFIEIALSWLYLFVVIAICGCTVCLLLIGGPIPPVGSGTTPNNGPKHYQFMGYVTAAAPGVDLAHKFMGRTDRGGDVEMR